MIAIIAAIGKNRELGKDNKLLWHIQADMKRFKKLTLNQVVIMGRKTYESLPEKFRPLPKRINIVISRQLTNQTSNIKRLTNDTKLIFTNSVEEAIKKGRAFKKEVFIIGGASIYKQTLSLADKLYLTLVEKNYPQADAFFPAYKKFFSKIVYQKKGEENGLKFQFLELIR